MANNAGPKDFLHTFPSLRLRQKKNVYRGFETARPTAHLPTDQPKQPSERWKVVSLFLFSDGLVWCFFWLSLLPPSCRARVRPHYFFCCALNSERAGGGAAWCLQNSRRAARSPGAKSDSPTRPSVPSTVLRVPTGSNVRLSVALQQIFIVPLHPTLQKHNTLPSSS